VALTITLWGSSSSTLPELTISSIAVTTFEYWSMIPEAHGLRNTRGGVARGGISGQGCCYLGSSGTL
jgi:hypothetical protein